MKFNVGINSVLLYLLKNNIRGSTYFVVYCYPSCTAFLSTQNVISRVIKKVVESNHCDVLFYDIAAIKPFRNMHTIDFYVIMHIPLDFM